MLSHAHSLRTAVLKSRLASQGPGGGALDLGGLLLPSDSDTPQIRGGSLDGLPHASALDMPGAELAGMGNLELAAAEAALRQSLLAADAAQAGGLLMLPADSILGSIFSRTLENTGTNKGAAPLAPLGLSQGEESFKPESGSALELARALLSQGLGQQQVGSTLDPGSGAVLAQQQQGLLGPQQGSPFDTQAGDVLGQLLALEVQAVAQQGGLELGLLEAGVAQQQQRQGATKREQQRAILPCEGGDDSAGSVAFTGTSPGVASPRSDKAMTKLKGRRRGCSPDASLNTDSGRPAEDPQAKRRRLADEEAAKGPHQEDSPSGCNEGELFQENGSMETPSLSGGISVKSMVEKKRRGRISTSFAELRKTINGQGDMSAVLNQATAVIQKQQDTIDKLRSLLVASQLSKIDQGALGLFL